MPRPPSPAAPAWSTLLLEPEGPACDAGAIGASHARGAQEDLAHALDTLAAAYAETGKIAEAVATVKKALDLAKAASARLRSISRISDSRRIFNACLR